MEPSRPRSTRRTPRRPARQGQTWARWLLVFSVAVAAATGLAFITVAAAIASVRNSLPDLSALYRPPSQTSRVYAANGELIASLYQENRAYVPLAQIPQVLQQAVIAIEDERFYHHRGVDLRGTARAAWRNLTRQAVVEGGSTITQQLARNLFLTQERTLERKVQEVLLAIEIERRLTKDEILERYLNEVYFGRGAYGVEMASRVFFGKGVRDLGLPGAAYLAGLIQAPSRYAPPERFEAAKRRQRQVLAQMRDLGFITPRQAEEAGRVRLALRTGPANLGMTGIRAPYFVSYLIPFLVQRYGEETVYKGGLRIYTTLDVTMQRIAQETITRGVAEARAAGLRISQGALVAIDPRTGHIKAMVGGTDFQTSQFNRAWQARRQPGSAFKPFIYVAALEAGVSPDQPLLDRPVEYRIAGFGYWRPKNYDGTYWGSVPLRRALEHSRNIPAVRMLAELGPQTVIATARRIGIRSTLQPNLSLALGTSEVTPLEMASAYGTLATNGIYTQPMAITRVLDASGRVLEDVIPERRVALAPEVAYVMTDILRGVIARGTGRAAEIGRPAAGKTGTTDDYRNAWFVGYTPNLSVAVWVGNDDNTPMNRVTGGTVPARLWARFMRAALHNVAPLHFERPANVVEYRVCVRQSDDGGCEAYATHAYIRGTATPAPPPVQSPTPAPPQSSDNGAVVGQVAILRPPNGAVVASPFVIEGRVPPGWTARLVIVMEGGPIAIRVTETSLPVGPDGGFGYTFESSLRFSGARYVITVTTTGPDGTTSTATVTVTER
ncbi:MAG: penicillin-binding protein 1A [Armatimonadota bacterium]|nr:penicillin-binding protein 1A [Armatimonadota bacterium]